MLGASRSSAGSHLIQLRRKNRTQCSDRDIANDLSLPPKNCASPKSAKTHPKEIVIPNFAKFEFLPIRRNAICDEIPQVHLGR